MDNLRDYQLANQNAVFSELTSVDSTLGVMPTGTGKTQVYLSVAHNWTDGGVLALGHREELVWQPFNRYRDIYGDYPEMVMGEYSRSTHSRAKLTVASKDSLHPERLKREFPDPKEIGLIIIDEAHHCVKRNATYQRILDYFPHAKRFGLTATPDRADEEALGQCFESVAFDYPLMDPTGGPSAITDGWLVPINQELITVEAVNLNLVKTQAGDLEKGSLEREMIGERPLHRITGATEEICGTQPTLIFTAGVTHAVKCAEIFNRHADGSAYCLVSKVAQNHQFDFVVNSRDAERRRRILKSFDQGGFPRLVNVGVLTEGFDAPTTRAMVMGRPTKSRALYAQMLGRGTRILPNVIEGRIDDTWWRLSTPDERKAAIAASDKPFCRVVDFTFTGNVRHELVTSFDILGGRYPDEIVARAKKKAEKEGGGDVLEMLEEAVIDNERERQQRFAIQAEVKIQRRNVSDMSPAEVLGLRTVREPGWHKGRKPIPKQCDVLRKRGVDDKTIAAMSFCQASQMIGALFKRQDDGLCSYKQAKILAKYDQPTNVGFEEAKFIIDSIAANGWKPIDRVIV